MTDLPQAIHVAVARDHPDDPAILLDEPHDLADRPAAARGDVAEPAATQRLERDRDCPRSAR